MVSESSWFLCAQDILLPLHATPASFVDASAENGAVPALSATAGLGQAGESTFPAVDGATG